MSRHHRGHVRTVSGDSPRALLGRAGGSVVAAHLIQRTGRLDVARQPQVFRDRRIVRQRGPASRPGRPVSRVDCAAGNKIPIAPK